MCISIQSIRDNNSYLYVPEGLYERATSAFEQQLNNGAQIAEVGKHVISFFLPAAATECKYAQSSFVALDSGSMRLSISRARKNARWLSRALEWMMNYEWRLERKPKRNSRAYLCADLLHNDRGLDKVTPCYQ